MAKNINNNKFKSKKIYNCKPNAFDVGFIINTLILSIVAFNSYTAAQYSHGEILALSAYNWVQHALMLGLLFAVLWRAVKKPANSLDMLFYLTVLVEGMYVYRFAIFDELISIAVLVGIIIAKKVREYKKYSIIYYLLMAHIYIMSIVGMLLFSEFRALRYILIAGLVILLLYYNQRYRLQSGDEQEFHHAMIMAALIYALAYLINALIMMNYKSLETIEGIGGAGSGYQGLIYLFTAPSCFKVLGSNQNFRQRFMAAVAVLLAATVAVFADSRYVMLTLTIAFLFSVPHMNWRIILAFAIAILGVTSLAGFIYLENPLIILTLLADVFAQDFGGSRQINYYGTVIETASGDQGRMLLVINGFYYLINEKLGILTGIGTYGYVHEAYKMYEHLLQSIGLTDNVVNYSLGGTPPRPPSLATYAVDYGLIFITMIFYLWFSFLKKTISIFKSRPEAISYPINLLLFMAVGEQLDSIATYFLLFPTFGYYIYQKKREIG